jgi:hypothetical protein
MHLDKYDICIASATYFCRSSDLLFLTCIRGGPGTAKGRTANRRTLPGRLPVSPVGVGLTAPVFEGFASRLARSLTPDGTSAAGAAALTRWPGQ